MYLESFEYIELDSGHGKDAKAWRLSFVAWVPDAGYVNEGGRSNG